MEQVPPKDPFPHNRLPTFWETINQSIWRQTMALEYLRVGVRKTNMLKSIYRATFGFRHKNLHEKNQRLLEMAPRCKCRTCGHSTLLHTIGERPRHHCVLCAQVIQYNLHGEEVKPDLFKFQGIPPTREELLVRFRRNIGLPDVPRPSHRFNFLLRRLG